MSTEHPAPPRPPAITATCPHCGGTLEMHSILFYPATDSPASPTPVDIAPTSRGTQQWVSQLLDWSSQGARMHSARRPPLAIPTPFGRISAGWLLPLALLLLVLLGRLPSQPVPFRAPPNPVAMVPTAQILSPAVNADGAAALEVVAAYNQAEAEVAQTLRPDPIQPYLDPDGPLWKRQSTWLAQRRATNATHATRLLRWSVGTVSVDAAGISATITTQETWEDQASGQLPRTATVRVVYTLRRQDLQAPWRIVDAVQTPL